MFIHIMPTISPFWSTQHLNNIFPSSTLSPHFLHYGLCQTWWRVILTKCGWNDKMLIFMWGNWREDMETRIKNGMRVGKMETKCWYEDNTWGLCGENVVMTTIHGDYVGNTLIFSPYIAHIFSVPHKETSTGYRILDHIDYKFIMILRPNLYSIRLY